MLQVQVDAAINPGNSGGPAWSGNKVVGLAFQGYSDAQNVGYIIPVPLIKHFLHEVLERLNYRGFPILPAVFQTLENAFLREHYQMKPDQSGVRIAKVDPLCDAFNKLKPNDIILEIDGLPISNEGTVDIPGVGSCIDFIHVTHMKYIGDTVSLKVLRCSNETEEAEIHMITVALDHVPFETEIVPQEEHDKAPTYYIASGIVFVPLTRNYLAVSNFSDYYLPEHACLLSEMPKRYPDEQIVLINTILDCEHTEGYDHYKDVIVKKVNGKPIKNMSELIQLLEQNSNGVHVIELLAGNKLVVKNMSKQEHNSLLKKYYIASDRSEDLRLVVDSPSDSMIAEVGSDDEERKNADANAADDNGTDDVMENVTDPSSMPAALPGLTPGLARFNMFVQQLEKSARHNDVLESYLAQNSATIDPDAETVSYHLSSDPDSSGDEMEAAQENSQKQTRVPPQQRLTRSRLFEKRRLQSESEESEVDEVVHKRLRKMH